MRLSVRSMATTLIWLPMVIYGIWGGWELPVSPQAHFFPGGLTGILLSVVPGVAFVLASIFPYRPAQLLYLWLQKPADRVFGQGWYRKVVLQMGIAAWFGVGMLLHGVVGLIRSFMLDASESAFLTCNFFFVGGIGMLCYFAISRRRYIAEPRLVA